MKRLLTGISCLFFSLNAFASFIEATIGTAVVNDATASFFNPSALILLKNQQLISLNSFASLRTHFAGETTQSVIGLSQTGTSSTQTHYFLPSFYYGKPISSKATIGLAVVSNFFNQDIDDHSILRYVQANNNISSIDVVPAIGWKINDFFSIGAAINFSYARFIMRPLIGFPTLNIPDTQSHNDGSDTAVSEDIGFLIKPGDSTLIGFNYRSKVTYNLSGKSIFASNPSVISNNYNFTFWTPAREVISINQQLSSSFGLIGTAQRIEWNIFQNIHVNNIATPLGIVNVNVPYHFHNAWVFTVGCHLKATPQWVVRFATTYNQSPGNNHYQIVNGDSIIVGASTAYQINKTITLDGSYAHAFIKNENIHVQTAANSIIGINKATRDSVSLKVTFNI